MKENEVSSPLRDRPIPTGRKTGTGGGAGGIAAIQPPKEHDELQEK